MRLLKNPNSDTPHLVLHVGLGLIGQSIQTYLTRDIFELDRSYVMDWAGPSAAKTTIRQAGQDMTLISGMTPARIDVIWSAGLAGFAADRDAFETETEIFDALLQLVRELSKVYQVRFHHFSSAGGLFEGQRCVRQESVPVPRRVYGNVKLEQEDSVLALPKSTTKNIYRPSSVYGYNRKGNRAGLVTALVQRGLSGQAVEIFGRPETLRDYVYVDDIGRFIARIIQQDDFDNRVLFLTGGKPTSMFEMLQQVQSLLKKRLHFRFMPDAYNARHMSFDRSVFPEGWKPTQTRVGLKKTILNIQRDFV